ncbi:MAG: phenylalanine--tRNA ligase subunit beta [Ignavibacteriales bacterium]|nr:phenylalanine--tRNA ligase subunit beta [Ignavibacteriales bacterium]
MRISYKWLQNYIELKNSPKEVAEKLTSIGLEVESIEYLGKKYDGFVVGEVVEVSKHPNADRLSVCKVRLSQSTDAQQIVCGAPNVAAGQKVIVGLPGATIPKNQHDPDGKSFSLTKAKIRGIESNGMICSSYELGIGEDKNGIIVLDSSTPVGISLSQYLKLDDIVFELGITPNRPDCLSHIGVARDLAAVYGSSLKYPKVDFVEKKNFSINKIFTVKVENNDDCPRYTARVIENVTVKESPEWLKQFLSAVGLRPINNIVDITNFVMLEFGQPLHAFDFNNLAKNTIIVKRARVKEKFTTLDKKSHELNGTELMICDGDRSVAIGGVMGGMNSEISEATKTVLLESAFFSPTSVRKTAKRLGISTDASYRFERGTDPNMVDEASRRAAGLIAEIAGGEIVQGVIDVYPKVIEKIKIELRIFKVNDILGTNLSLEKINGLLQTLGIETQVKNNSLICSVPTYRPDIEQEIDLIEEVARLYGYDNIPNQTTVHSVFSQPSKIELHINEIRSWCESVGLHEVMTNSLLDEATALLYSTELIKVKNPLSVDLEVMRPMLLPTMLTAVLHNYNHGATSVRLFEIGSTFLAKHSEKTTRIQGISEYNKLGLILSGNAHDLTWYSKEREYDIFDLKGMVQSLLSKLGLDNIHLIYYDASSSLTEQTIGIEINGTYVGFLGQCSQKVLAQHKIERKVLYCELDLSVLIAVDEVRKFKEYSKFPSVKRDIAFVVKKNITAGDIETAIKESGGASVTSISLFDIFEGASIGEGNKSLAFSVTMQSREKTLTDSGIDALMKKIIASVVSTYGATLRSL